MAQHCIKGKRIRRVCIPKEYDIDKILKLPTQKILTAP